MAMQTALVAVATGQRPPIPPKTKVLSGDRSFRQRSIIQTSCRIECKSNDHAFLPGAEPEPGIGYTRLAVALRAAERGLSKLVLEGGTISFGCDSRTGGQTSAILNPVCSEMTAPAQM